MYVVCLGKKVEGRLWFCFIDVVPYGSIFKDMGGFCHFQCFRQHCREVLNDITWSIHVGTSAETKNPDDGIKTYDV